MSHTLSETSGIHAKTRFADLLRRARQLRLREQIVDTITHGAGFALAIAALVLLTVRAAGSADAMRFVACVIFGATLVILYGASTIYHALHHTW